MASKKHERATKRAMKRERQAQKYGYLSEDENFASFSNQLEATGFKLKDIPGDGNCLFRALADQFEGDMSQHRKYRQEIVDYMIRNREDFEPFVEDDVSFKDHVKNLGKEGTFAGNDTIVAFSRLYKANVTIHQLNAPCLQVNGAAHALAPSLHISYHNGDHYSSVRQLTDTGRGPGMARQGPAERTIQRSSETPTKSKKKGKGAAADPVAIVKQATGYQDTAMIEQTLEDTLNDIDATIGVILQIMEVSGIAEAPENPLEVKAGATAVQRKHIKQEKKPREEPHLSNRKRKEMAKTERKERRLEEQRNQRRPRADVASGTPNSSLPDFETLRI